MNLFASRLADEPVEHAMMSAIRSYFRDMWPSEGWLWREPVPRPDAEFTERSHGELIRRIIREEQPVRVQVVRPEPDDVIVVECQGHISKDNAERLKEQIKTIWPDRLVIIIDNGLRLTFAGK